MTTINDPSDSSSDDINVSDLTQDQLLVLRKAYLDGKFSSKQLCFDGADMLIEKINSMETTSPIQQCIIDKKNKLNDIFKFTSDKIKIESARMIDEMKTESSKMIDDCSKDMDLKTLTQ